MKLKFFLFGMQISSKAFAQNILPKKLHYP